MIPLCFSITLSMHFIMFLCQISAVSGRPSFLSLFFLFVLGCCMFSHAFLLHEIPIAVTETTSLLLFCIPPIILCKHKIGIDVARSPNAYTLSTAWAVSWGFLGEISSNGISKRTVYHGTVEWNSSELTRLIKLRKSMKMTTVRRALRRDFTIVEV